MKVLVILNPASGKNTIELIREAVTRQFTISKIAFEIYESKREDNLGDIVRARLKDGFELVVAAGGDGTVSKVINGLVGTHIPLGIIPAGTANLLAQELKVPLSIEDAIALIIGRHEFKKIDVMKIGHRVYDLNVSSGLSATVVSNTTPENKSRFGFFAYVWMTIVKLFTLKDHYFVVTVDGKTLKSRAAEIAIFNCGIIAKSLYPQGPDILVDDGRLNIWVLNAKTIQDYPWYLFQMIARRPAKHLSHFVTAEKKISIKSDVPVQVQADGDIIGMTPIEIEGLPGAIEVIVPEKRVTAQ
jgi:YegS/Rv2252/BmrU family lipid kinase